MSLQKSLNVQEDLSGHAERQNQVEDFKNRFEALSSPMLVQCFAEGNIIQASQYVTFFASIKSLPQLFQYYRAVQKNSLQQKWKQLLDLPVTSSETEANAQSINQHVLATFYDQLWANCQNEIKWCTQVFVGKADSDMDIMGISQPFLVIAEVLPSLQPTRDAYITTVINSSNDRLEVLEKFSQVNCQPNKMTRKCKNLVLFLYIFHIYI